MTVTFTALSHHDALPITGASAINAFGNALNNVLTGNTGNNVLDGGAGNDTMAGGAGNDTYVVDVATDVVTEIARAHVCIPDTDVTCTPASTVKNLNLNGT